jgi:hypothetical protein
MYCSGREAWKKLRIWYYRRKLRKIKERNRKWEEDQIKQSVACIKETCGIDLEARKKEQNSEYIKDQSQNINESSSSVVEASLDALNLLSEQKVL